MASIKEFEVLSALGSGSFSSVYKVKRISDGQEYALKKVKLPNLSLKEKENALNEVRILASINHKNIVSYKQAFYDETSQSLCIVMEFASGGDLLNKIKPYKKRGSLIPEETIWSYLIQMIQGLKTLHDMKILHRDLKCANIFLGSDDKTIKLGDLNVSKIAKQGLVYTQAGTPYYASPEIWQERPYGMKSDIWSLGCVIYELCSHVPPFRANDIPGLYQKILRGVYERIPAYYSDELSKVIGMCLSLQPSMRPCCNKLLSHPSIASRLTEADVAAIQKGPGFVELLETIKVPLNWKRLNDMLPKPNYKSNEASLSPNISEKFEEDFRARIFNVRPVSRLGRADVRKNIFVANEFTLAKDFKEDSVERIVLTRGETRGVGQKNTTGSVPPAENTRLVRVAKMNPLQKIGKAIIMDIFRKKREVEKIQEEFQAQILRHEDEKLPVIPNPSSKCQRKSVEPKDTILVRTRGEKMEGLRSITPNIRPRKISDDIVGNIKDSERIIIKDQSAVAGDITRRRLARII